eukprot:Gb_02617 [translate_table: standard]
MKLQLYDLDGNKEREWLLDSTIRYIKVSGGPCGGEGLLVGSKSGLVVRIWINNNIPIHIYKHNCAIRCLDLSFQRTQLAIVDENGTILVYDLQVAWVSGDAGDARDGSVSPVRVPKKPGCADTWGRALGMAAAPRGDGQVRPDHLGYRRYLHPHPGCGSPARWGCAPGNIGFMLSHLHSY